MPEKKIKVRRAEKIGQELVMMEGRIKSLSLRSDSTSKEKVTSLEVEFFNKLNEEYAPIKGEGGVKEMIDYVLSQAHSEEDTYEKGYNQMCTALLEIKQQIKGKSNE